MNLEVQTTLLNTYPPTLIATIPKALRECSSIGMINFYAVGEVAAQYQTFLLVMIKKMEEDSWDDVKGEYLPEDLVLAARRDEIAWVHSEGAFRNCSDASV